MVKGAVDVSASSASNPLQNHFCRAQPGRAATGFPHLELVSLKLGEVLLLRYTQSLITPMAQTAVCNRHHSIDQQLCRWLLLSLDRLPTNQVCMTQELIANMLGVRREGVTEAAGKLQKLGAIAYQRDHINVTDRARLESLCCECYAVVRKETDRLLPYVPSRPRP